MGDTEEGRATVQKLQAQLKEQENDLEETEYEQYIEDQKSILNDWYEDLQEWINDRLDNLDLLVSEAIEATNLNGSEIADTILTTADSIGYTVTDDFANIWENFSIANDENFNILTMTSDTTTDMRLKMDELATEAGLEEYFTGEDLALLESITSVDNNLTNANAAIQLSNEAINNVESRVSEASSNITSSISSAADQISGTLSDYKASTDAAIEEAKNEAAEAKSEASSSKQTSSSSSSSSSNSENYYVDELYDYNGAKCYKKSFSSQSAAQSYIDKMHKQGYSGGSIYHYAKGGIVGNKDNILDVIAQSFGEDHMVATKEGERILTEDQNEAFEKMVNANFTPLDSSELAKYSMLSSSVEGLNQTPNVFDGLSTINTPDVANNMSNIGNTTVGDINISLPNVTDKQQFVSWLKNDNQISKVIQSMTIGQMMGKNSYDKLKY